MWGQLCLALDLGLLHTWMRIQVMGPTPQKAEQASLLFHETDVHISLSAPRLTSIYRLICESGRVGKPHRLVSL